MSFTRNICNKYDDNMCMIIRIHFKQRKWIDFCYVCQSYIHKIKSIIFFTMRILKCKKIRGNNIVLELVVLLWNLLNRKKEKTLATQLCSILRSYSKKSEYNILVNAKRWSKWKKESEGMRLSDLKCIATYFLIMLIIKIRLLNLRC